LSFSNIVEIDGKGRKETYRKKKQENIEEVNVE
jgi:hypothetical protein